MALCQSFISGYVRKMSADNLRCVVRSGVHLTRSYEEWSPLYSHGRRNLLLCYAAASSLAHRQKNLSRMSMISSRCSYTYIYRMRKIMRRQSPARREILVRCSHRLFHATVVVKRTSPSLSTREVHLSGKKPTPGLLTDDLSPIQQ